MNILFYTPLNGRCRDIESQAIEFSKQGHSIYLLTQSKQGIIHENFSSYNFKVSSTNFFFQSFAINLTIQFGKFIYHCWRNRIDLVYAHLEPSNFVAVICQYFVRSRVVICRHHMDYAALTGMDKHLSYRITYKHAKNIIVVSTHTKAYMVRKEKVPSHLIHQINLSYNFDLYAIPQKDRVKTIRQMYQADALLLTVGRLDELKRPILSIRLISELKKNNINAKLLILGEGEMMKDMEKYVQEINLAGSVFLLGYVDNVLEYMAACDLLIHPSISESSCISLKEAGLVELPVIVCKGVGDFDEVVSHNENGFLVSQDNFVEESAQIVTKVITKIGLRDKIGKSLRATVLREFDIKKVAPVYEHKFHSKHN